MNVHAAMLDKVLTGSAGLAAAVGGGDDEILPGSDRGAGAGGRGGVGRTKAGGMVKGTHAEKVKDKGWKPARPCWPRTSGVQR